MLTTDLACTLLLALPVQDLAQVAVRRPLVEIESDGRYVMSAVVAGEWAAWTERSSPDRFSRRAVQRAPRLDVSVYRRRIGARDVERVLYLPAERMGLAPHLALDEDGTLAVGLPGHVERFHANGERELLALPREDGAGEYPEGYGPYQAVHTLFADGVVLQSSRGAESSLTFRSFANWGRLGEPVVLSSGHHAARVGRLPKFLRDGAVLAWSTAWRGGAELVFVDLEHGTRTELPAPATEDFEVDFFAGGVLGARSRELGGLFHRVHLIDWRAPRVHTLTSARAIERLLPVGALGGGAFWDPWTGARLLHDLRYLHDQTVWVRAEGAELWLLPLARNTEGVVLELRPRPDAAPAAQTLDLDRALRLARGEGPEQVEPHVFANELAQLRPPFGPRVHEVLEAALQSTDPNVRVRVAGLLAHDGGPRSAALLRAALLREESHTTRRMMARHLAQAPAPEAVTAVTKALPPEDVGRNMETAQRLCATLAALGDPAAIPYLTELSNAAPTPARMAIEELENREEALATWRRAREAATVQ